MQTYLFDNVLVAWNNELTLLDVFQPFIVHCFLGGLDLSRRAVQLVNLCVKVLDDFLEQLILVVLSLFKISGALHLKINQLVSWPLLVNLKVQKFYPFKTCDFTPS